MKTWFKFYGQEFLSDPKMLSLDTTEKVLWLVILCLASSSEEEGVIRYISSQKIIQLAGIQGPTGFYTNFLTKFEKLKMIKVDNKEGENVIIVRNYEKRQEKVLSDYERLKNWRERKKLEKKLASNDNEMITDDNGSDNVRIDKNRIEKKRTDNIYNIGASPNFKKLEEAKQNLAEKLSHHNGISQAWQEKAFRYAKYLHISLDDQTLKGRWLHFFKFNQNSVVDSAVSSVKDAPTFLTIDKPEEKVKYFFSVCYGRIKPS